jgi:outer membrane protein assembly factor BamB
VPSVRHSFVACLLCVAAAGTAGAQPKPPATPAAESASGFQPMLEVALDAQPAAPAAFDADAAYLPLRGERLVAVELTTGNLRWTSDIATTWAPAVSDGTVVVAADEWLAGLDARTGRTRWRVPVAGGFSTAPEINGGWVVAGGRDGDLLVMRAVDGAPVWSRSLGAAASAPAVATPAGIFATLVDGRVVALALDSGEPLWELKLDGRPGPLLVLDDRIFLGADDKFFYSLRVKDGKIRWRQRVGGRPAGRPSADRRRAYYVALDNILWAFDRDNGGRKWHTPMPMRPSGGPLAVGDAVIVAGVAAEVHAYRPDTGAETGVLKWPADLAAPPQIIPSALAALTSIAMVTRTGVFTVIARTVEPRPSAAPYPLGTEIPLSALDAPAGP